MCAQFLIKASIKDLESLFGIQLPDFHDNVDRRILPHNKSIVITAGGAKDMSFSLVPSWSKDRRPKFATHNARIETLAEKPTWKKPLETKRCLVPLTAFIEPIYHNELAGHMVAFRAEKSDVLVAAGIYDEWLDKETGEVIESFAIITQDPIEYVKNVGHDRSPLFLKSPSFKKWLAPQKHSAQEWTEFLQKQSAIPQLHTTIDRALKPGREKRK